MSIPIYKMMVATDWRHLPFAGGVLDQPEWLWADIFTLIWRKAILKEAGRSLSATLMRGGKFGMAMD